jgi:hypothetical protein
MGKAKANKRMKTADGLVFSRVLPALQDTVRLVRTRISPEVLNHGDHPAWNELFRSWLVDVHPDKHSTDRLLAYPVLLKNTLMVLNHAKWKTIYVASEAVVDFIENSYFRDSDAPLVEKAVATLYADVGENGLVIHYANRQDSTVLHRLKVDSEHFTGFYTGDVFGAVPAEDIGDWNREYGQLNTQGKQALNTIINLYLYMDVFADCVTDSPPKIIAGTLDAGPARTVRTSVDIDAVYREARVSPHMRRGHFRLLQSARFTRKKGQAVYVRPTMVRGSVRTVTEDPVEEQQNEIV